MEIKTISLKKLTEYILWITAYIPVILLLIIKYLKQNILSHNIVIYLNKFYKTLNYSSL